MEAMTQKLFDSLNNCRRYALERHAESYVAVRANATDDGTVVGHGTLEFQRCGNPQPHFRLENALYYERYDEYGQLVEVKWNDTLRLGRLALFSFIDALYPSLEASSAAQQASQGAVLEKATRRLDGMITAANPTPLWWEVERASKAEQRERLIALRREIRTCLNSN